MSTWRPVVSDVGRLPEAGLEKAAFELEVRAARRELLRHARQAAAEDRATAALLRAIHEARGRGVFFKGIETADRLAAAVLGLPEDKG